jgi:hypothetical protein
MAMTILCATMAMTINAAQMSLPAIFVKHGDERLALSRSPLFEIGIKATNRMGPTNKSSSASHNAQRDDWLILSAGRMSGRRIGAPFLGYSLKGESQTQCTVGLTVQTRRLVEASACGQRAMSDVGREESGHRSSEIPLVRTVKIKRRIWCQPSQRILKQL